MRIAAAGSLAAGLTVAGAVVFRHASEPAPAPAAAAAADPAADLNTFVGRTRDQLQRTPRDWNSWAALGMAYVQLVRVTGDPAYYPRAQDALGHSLAVRTAAANAPALTGLAALAASRHDFAAAVTHASAAVRADPYAADAYGALADGLIETGHYPEAFAAVQKMVDLRPDTGSYARASYTYELRGQTARALELMNLALTSADGPADLLFAETHLADLEFGTGNLPAARAQAEAGLARFPADPGLLAVRAKIRAALGDTAGAIGDLRSAVALRPLPAYAWSLGELLEAAGDRDAARRAYALVTASRQLALAQSSTADLDVVLFEADHGDPRQAVTDARALYARRGSNQVADALAWALHAAGQDAEALKYADRALSLGATDPMAHYHRGLIRLSLGQRDGARDDFAAALKINPYFSPTRAASARAALTALEPTK